MNENNENVLDKYHNVHYCYRQWLLLIISNCKLKQMCGYIDEFGPDQLQLLLLCCVG